MSSARGRPSMAGVSGFFGERPCPLTIWLDPASAEEPLPDRLERQAFYTPFSPSSRRVPLVPFAGRSARPSRKRNFRLMPAAKATVTDRNKFGCHLFMAGAAMAGLASNFTPSFRAHGSPGIEGLRLFTMGMARAGRIVGTTVAMRNQHTPVEVRRDERPGAIFSGPRCPDLDHLSTGSSAVQPAGGLGGPVQDEENGWLAGEPVAMARQCGGGM